MKLNGIDEKHSFIFKYRRFHNNEPTKIPAKLPEAQNLFTKWHQKPIYLQDLNLN